MGDPWYVADYVHNKKALVVIIVILWALICWAWYLAYDWEKYECAVTSHLVDQSSAITWKASFGFCIVNSTQCNSKVIGKYDSYSGAESALHQQHPLHSRLDCFENTHYNTVLHTNTSGKDAAYMYIAALFFAPFVAAAVLQVIVLVGHAIFECYRCCYPTPESERLVHRNLTLAYGGDIQC